MRGAGSAFLGLAMFYWTAAKDADKFMLGSTLTFALSSVVLPFYAQQNLPVNMPKHLGSATIDCIQESLRAASSSSIGCILQ